MSWTIRLGVLFLVLGIIYKLDPCSAYKYSLNVYAPVDDPDVRIVDYTYEEFDLRTACYQAAFSWWIFNIPQINGTCFANQLNCTNSQGIVFYYPSQACTGNDVCCINPRNYTVPPTMPSTIPTVAGFPEMTTMAIPTIAPGGGLPGTGSVIRRDADDPN